MFGQFLPKAVLFGLLSSTILLSCKKEDNILKTPEQMLTRIPWKIEELRYLQNNVTHYYKRGATQNTDNYDVEYIEFLSDKTGRYRGADLSNSVFSWSFVNAEKTIIRIDYQGGLTINWENVMISENSIRYTEYYSRNGANLLGQGYRTPK